MFVHRDCQLTFASTREYWITDFRRYLWFEDEDILNCINTRPGEENATLHYPNTKTHIIVIMSCQAAPWPLARVVRSAAGTVSSVVVFTCLVVSLERSLHIYEEFCSKACNHDAEWVFRGCGTTNGFYRFSWKISAISKNLFILFIVAYNHSFGQNIKSGGFVAMP